MAHEHRYQVTAEWTGNTGEGTKTIRSYSRDHIVSFAGKPELELTTDNKSVGNPNKLNPEDLLVSAVSSCHMLSYLYVCALEGIVITSYIDKATGLMIEHESGGGSFKEVVLNPEFTVAEASMVDRAIALHHQAHEICFIASSVNFDVNCFPVCKV